MRIRLKVLRVFAIVMAGMLMLSSCGDKEGQQKVEEVIEKQTQSISLETIDLDTLEFDESTWKDNSLDKYSATYNHELKRSYPNDAVFGGGNGQFLASGRAYRLRKHLFTDASKNWDEVSFVTDDGKNGSKEFISNNSQIWQIGAVAGTEECLLETIIWQEEGNYAEHHVLVVDENMNSILDIYLPFLDGEDYVVFDKMMMDAVKNLHLVYGGCYIIVDRSGNIISEYQYEGAFEHLYIMKDGQVALKVHMVVKEENTQSYSFLYYDTTKNEWKKLAEFVAPCDANWRVAVCPDKDTLLYADKKGVYKGKPTNLDGATLIYEWQKHGIIVTDVKDLQYLEGDRITLICEEGDKMHYLNLEPTKEEVPIQIITFAIPESKKNMYEKLVATFNRKYPAYQIVLRTDYDKTALLTKLMAGDGPDMIDTYITGFAEQKELWLPLNKILEKLGVLDELVLPVMELGSIDGQLYGIVSDFSIETVVTIGDESRNWKFDELEREILENRKLEALTDSITCKDGWDFIARFLFRGVEDSYFVDQQTGKTRFGDPQVREVLETIKRYYGGTVYYEAGKLLEEGRVLCNPVTISRPEQLALYRMFYGEKLQYSGYPTINGGKHFLYSGLPITIRRNASEEEITGACLFFKMLLSYDIQAETITNDMLNFSVRKDVLEEQLAAVNEYTYAYALGIERIQLGDEVDFEKDKETFYSLLENAIPKKVMPRELLNIFIEELPRYLEGEISVDMVLEHLDNRVQLYLDEN